MTSGRTPRRAAIRCRLVVIDAKANLRTKFGRNARPLISALSTFVFLMNIFLDIITVCADSIDQAMGSFGFRDFMRKRTFLQSIPLLGEKFECVWKQAASD
jgi:hypothetical protein